MACGAMVSPDRLAERKSKSVVSPRSSSRYAPRSKSAPKICGTSRPWRRKCREKARNAAFSSRTPYKMPIADWFPRERRMILRPEPPSSPWSGWMRSGAAWKCFSNSLFKTSMKLVPAHLDSQEKQNRLFSIIAVCRGRHSIARELLFLLIGKVKLARGPLLSGQRPRYTLEMPSRKVVRNPRQRRITEERNLASRNLDRMSSREIIRLMNREDRKVAPAVGRAVPAIAGAVDEIVARMTGGGRLIYVGAGSSGRIGVLAASEGPPAFGVSPKILRAFVAGGQKGTSASQTGGCGRSGH